MLRDGNESPPPPLGSDYTKPPGWRREPARHALAAKGVETGQGNSGSQTALLPSKQALRSHTFAVGSDLKETAAEDLVARALEEAGQDDEKAIDLIRDTRWFDKNVKLVARDRAQGAQVATLERELKSAFSDQKSAPVEKSGERKVEPRAQPRPQADEKLGVDERESS